MKRILVGNVDAGITEQSLRSAFEVFGTVVRVSLGHTDGFALVEMKHSAQADRAMAALDGTRLDTAAPAPLFLVALPSGRDPRGSLAGISPQHPSGSHHRPAPASSKRCTNTLSF